MEVQVPISNTRSRGQLNAAHLDYPAMHGELHMRLTRLVFAGFVVALAVGCDDDEIVTSSPPPLAGVRFINALAGDTAVDIRMIDQLEWSALALSLLFRSGTEHQPTEAKSRHIRVFRVSRDPIVTSQFLLDTTITFQANTNYTLLLVGSVAANTDRFVVLTDNVPGCTNDIAVRAVNAGVTGNADLFITRKAADTRPAQPSLANVAPFAASAYVTRPADTTFVRFTNAGDTTTIAAAAGPMAPATLPGQRPAAGVNSACSALSAIAFPRSVAGTLAPQTPARFTAPEVIYFVDRVP